jgi:hypothetical protein
MMALYPESVDLEELPAPPEPLRIPDWGIVDEGAFLGRPTPDHTLRREADPRLHASAALGQQLFGQVVHEIDARVRAALSDILPAGGRA